VLFLFVTVSLLFVCCVCAVMAVAPSITVLYFWSFVVIAYFILFNMVLAVIFTVYDEEYGEMKHELKKEKEEEERIADILKRGC
jgi:predicted membrane protein